MQLQHLHYGSQKIILVFNQQSIVTEVPNNRSLNNINVNANMLYLKHGTYLWKRNIANADHSGRAV
jgi:hypothetical protein